MKRYSILFVLAFLLLLFLFGCGSPPQDIGGGQSFQNQEAVPSSETPVALTEDSGSPQGEAEEGTEETIFAVYGDDKLIAAWGTDAEGNSYPISKEKAEKLIPSDFVEKMKSCKAFNVPHFNRRITDISGQHQLVEMTSSNTAYTSDFDVFPGCVYVGYWIKFSGVSNPCSTLVFKLGWVSPEVSDNTVTKYAPVPACAVGGSANYISVGTAGSPASQSWRLWTSTPNNDLHGGGDIFPSAGYGWSQEIAIFSHSDISKLRLGRWQIPTYGGSAKVCPIFWVRQLTVENLSASPATFLPGGGRKVNITGNIVCLPDKSYVPAKLTWTVEIKNSSGTSICSPQSGSNNKVNATWDGMINGKPAPKGQYTYKITVDAPDEKTSCSGGGRFTVGRAAITLNPNPVVPSDPPGARTTVTVSVINDSGAALSGAKVKIKAEAVARSGGHEHTGKRPVGQFYTLSGTKAGVKGSTSDGDTITYDTKSGSDGKVTLYYRATQFGGKERLTATLTGTSVASASTDLTVQVQGLELLPAGAGYTLVGTWNNCPHPVNHYGTSSVVKALPNIALDYRKLVPGAVLSYNDMSLGDANVGYGGLFDIGGKWIPPHAEHRFGRNVDMPVGNSKLKSIIIKYNGSPAVHSAGTANEHWHVTF